MTHNIPLANFNQAGNAQNPHQGQATKALCVCSAGLLRSPTIAKYLSGKGYNTRACGTSQDYALIPISQALLLWADEIHVVAEQAELVKELLVQFNIGEEVELTILDIPDSYGTFDPVLESIIKEFYEKFLTNG